MTLRAVNGVQANRLRREDWRPEDMQRLAEEIVALLTSDSDIELNDGPIIIRNNTNGPAILIRKTNDQTGSQIQLDDHTEAEKETSFIPEEIPNPSITGKVIPGRVVSHDSGNDYLVDFYEFGIDEDASRQETVRQVDISSSDTIPTGTFVWVSQTVEDEFLMQVPIWLE